MHIRVEVPQQAVIDTGPAIATVTAVEQPALFQAEPELVAIGRVVGEGQQAWTTDAFAKLRDLHRGTFPVLAAIEGAPQHRARRRTGADENALRVLGIHGHLPDGLAVERRVHPLPMAAGITADAQADIGAGIDHLRRPRMQAQGAGDRVEFQVLAQAQAMPGTAIVGAADDRLPYGGDQRVPLLITAAPQMKMPRVKPPSMPMDSPVTAPALGMRGSRSTSPFQSAPGCVGSALRRCSPAPPARASCPA